MFAYASILQAVLSFGMETTFFRYLNKYPDNKKQVYNNSFWAIFFITIIFLLVTLPFSHWLAGLIKIGNDTPQSEFERYIKYFVAILILDAWCAIPFAKLRADGRPGKFGMVKIINIVTMLSLNIVFIFVIPFIIRHNFAGANWCRQWFTPGWIGYIFLSNL